MIRILAAIVLAHWATLAGAQTFSFVAYGDTAYHLPRDTPRLTQLIDEVNAQAPAFAIHVGDFKGYTSCGDAAYETQRTLFARHAHPLILTPGDNDWADCDAETAGRFDPIERLARLRVLFFATDRSLGGRPMQLVRQSGVPENARWQAQGVLFATVHAIGPHNGLTRERRMALDSIDRSEAGERWVRETFRLARESGAPAVVLAFQADPWLPSAPMYENGPLLWLRDAIGEEAASFAGQVLVIHGDSHRFIVDTPYRRANVEAGSTRGMNVTRLQVPGWPDHRAVRIDVDTRRPAIFSFSVVMAAGEAAGAVP